MKKAVNLLIVFILILSSFLTSCGDREYDENEVKEAALSLIKETEFLNDILWGKGIAHSDDRNTSEGVYFEAVYADLYSKGFFTVSELKEKVKNTFSAAYSEQIFTTVLSAVSDGDQYLLSRYYQKYSILDGTTPETIMVNSEWEPLLNDNVAYDYDSIKVTGSKKELVYVTVDATVTRRGYDPQTRTVSVALIEEENGWRVDSPTYLSYDITIK